MKTAFETELARAVELGYRNEAAITEAVARTADALDILPVNVLGTIGKTQDQLFTQYLPQVSVPEAVVPQAPVTTPTAPSVTPPTGGEVVSVDPDSGTALVVDGNGNVEVVDNTDGILAPGDTVPTTSTAPVTTPTQTQPETGGGTQAGGVDFAEPTDNVVDPTLQDLLSGIGEEGVTTPNLPAVIPPTTTPVESGATTVPGTTGTQTGSMVVTMVDPVNQWALVVKEGTTVYFYKNNVLTDTFTGAPATLFRNTLPVQLGYYSPNVTGYFEGGISAATIHNRALTADERAELFALGRGKYYDFS
jgi:hypothetical protein